MNVSLVERNDDNENAGENTNEVCNIAKNGAIKALEEAKIKITGKSYN